MPAMRWSLVALTAVVLGGCYSYRVVPVEQAPVGETVRARVSAAEAEQLRDLIGRDDRLVVGQLLASPDSNLLVAVRTAGADAPVQMHQRITVPRQGLLELEVRRFDRWKTLGVAAVAVAAVTAVTVNQLNSTKPTEGQGKNGTNASRVLPVGISFRFNR
jgi:hypothetical protein